MSKYFFLNSIDPKHEHIDAPCSSLPVVIIMIKAGGVDQAHGPVDPDSAASEAEKNLQKATGGERRETREHKTVGERRRTVSNEHF